MFSHLDPEHAIYVFKRTDLEIDEADGIGI